MSWSRANHWCTTTARQYARDIANLGGLYCGPAVVGWIAAVWNIDVKGRRYDYAQRLIDKRLFPDGPRNVFGKPPGFEQSLNDVLQRETDGDLCISNDTIFKYATVHDELEKHDLPIIICMYPDELGLHYVALYKSEKDSNAPSPKNPFGLDRIQFYWQDNGLYGSRDDGNPGLHQTNWRYVGQRIFSFGAHRVKRT